MRFTTLRIDDFGCFRNARLEDLSEDIVVIGGPQRAGKTTFMHALRQFPAGVRRGDDLPPATDEYRVDAEITHDGHGYRYVLNGYAAPSVSPLSDGPEIGNDDVFGPVTERQYSQLYTIGLDELRRLPPGIDDTEDLAQVLLGGAYGDIAGIPEVQETFRKQAHDIGLKRGDPTATTTDLHGPYRTIRDGMEARREASQQVDEYNEVTGELQRKRSEKEKAEQELESKRQKRDRLNVLSEIFEPLQRLDALEAELECADTAAAETFPTHLTDRLEHFEEEFDEAVDDLAEAERAFERNADLATTDSYREWLLTHEAELTRLENERKIWAETVNDLTQQEERLSQQRSEIESDIATLHPDWDESFSHVDETDTSSVDTARVSELSSTVSDLRAEYEELADELRSQRTRRDTLQKELSEMEEKDGSRTEVPVPKRKPLLIAATAVAVGTGSGIITSPIVGGLVGLAIIAVGMYAVDSTITVEPTTVTAPRREIKAQVSSLEGEIDATETRVDGAESGLETKERELAELASRLGLPEDLPASQVPEFYDEIADLDEEISSYRREYEQWEGKREDLATELRDVVERLEDISDRSWSAESPLENADSVLSTLGDAAADLQLAREVRNAKAEREDCVDDVDSVLRKWRDEKSVDASTDNGTIRRRVAEFRDRAGNAEEITTAVEKREQLETQVTNRLDSPSTREVFGPLRKDDEPWIEVAETVADGYADGDAIEDRIRDVQGAIDDREDRRDDLREECLALERERDQLASEDDLREAQAQIDEGRVEFERVGEAYAVNRIAEEMVSRLHERLMEDVVHSLVDEASTIFSNITQEYDGIELDGELQDLEFRALRSSGPHHGVGELSRATAEQLFLAVRLARIRQTEVELPVVLDDAATNFDPDHISRVFEVVGELSTTNQVFFLTCHPEFVNLTSASGSSAQYWSLEDGVFTETDDAKVLERRLMAD
jgi:uncharacterized protein YhaN